MTDERLLPGTGCTPPVRADWWLQLEPTRLTLQAVADRMQDGLMRGAYSSIAREGGDCAAALLLPDARLLAQARSLPLLLGSLMPATQAVLAAFDPSSMREGDGFLLNDPWCGGSHLPDLTLVRPVFLGARLCGFAATVLHHQDVGGMTAGSIPPGATSVFQEGLRLPPVRSHREGRLDDLLRTVLCANSRTPDLLLGDLSSQWAAAELGARELAGLADRLGDAFDPVGEALLRQAQEMTCAALRAFPDGEASWSDALDGDGISEAPVHLQVRLSKQGERLLIDFSGSAPQTAGPINASQASMASAALYFMRTLAPQAPNNAGCLAPVTLVLPPGSVVNPNFPAAVNARTATVKLATNALLCAWGALQTQGSAAANAGVATVLSFSGQRADGSAFLATEVVASGAAGSSWHEGAAGVSTDVGNARNTPAELLEMQLPIRLEHYGLRAGSGGAGKHRGGDGVVRSYLLLEGHGSVSYRGERHHTAARGLHGGADGACARAHVLRGQDGRMQWLSPRAQFDWVAGDRLVVETAGAGGWGQPGERG